jgi:hypothetical protein
MDEHTKKKGRGWFTKKEVTTPLQILNKLLELPEEKQLKYNPLAMSQDEKGDKERNDKKDKKIIDKEKKDSDARQKDSDARQKDSDTGQKDSDTGQKDSDTGQKDSDTGQKDSDTKQKPSDTTSSSDTKDVTSIQFDFQEIDEQNKKYLKHIIPQLNEIYNLVTTPEKSDAGEDEVLFNIIRSDPSDPDRQVLEKTSSIFVPKYIPPIKTPPIKL